MFTFNPRPAFSATVTVHEPGAAEGQTFTGRFRALPQAETDRLQGPQIAPGDIAQANRDWLHLIFEGWEEDLCVDGAPLKVTPENRELLLGAPWVRTAVTLAYLREVSGAARKN